MFTFIFAIVMLVVSIAMMLYGFIFALLPVFDDTDRLKFASMGTIGFLLLLLNSWTTVDYIDSYMNDNQEENTNINLVTSQTTIDVSSYIKGYNAGKKDTYQKIFGEDSLDIHY